MIQELLIERPPVYTNRKASHRCKLSAHYRALLQRIQAANLSGSITETIEAIGVTSPERGAGVSTVAFNIAVAAARAEMGPVLYVDADITKLANRRLIPDSPEV